MKIQAVLADVAAADREEYLETWFELAAVLLSMEVRSDLFTEDGSPGRFLELTWFDEGSEAVLSDDRVVRLCGRLDALSERREGDLRLFDQEPLRGPGGT